LKEESSEKANGKREENAIKCAPHFSKEVYQTIKENQWRELSVTEKVTVLKYLCDTALQTESIR
jgi:hypothetical protein